MITITILVGLVRTTWENRYLIENLDVRLESARSAPDVPRGEPAPSAAARSSVIVSYKLAQRLGSAQRTAIVRYYCQGHSSRETAIRFNISKTAVLSILRELGVQPRPPHTKGHDPIC